MADNSTLTAERKRLVEDKNKVKHWRRWGPYMSERQWVSICGCIHVRSILLPTQLHSIWILTGYSQGGLQVF